MLGIYFTLCSDDATQLSTVDAADLLWTRDEIQERLEIIWTQLLMPLELRLDIAVRYAALPTPQLKDV